MVEQLYMDLIQEVLGIYREIDQMALRLQLATGVRCPPLCGICCESQEVEATVLECLPLANEIYNRGEDETTLLAIDENISRNDFRCSPYSTANGLTGEGRCPHYEVRPLVCRLFGFAFRKNKFGAKELCLCSVARASQTESMAAREPAGSSGLDGPIYQDCFMRVASLHPGIGYRLLPINLAIKQALGYLHWKRPLDFKRRKAA